MSKFDEAYRRFLARNSSHIYPGIDEIPEYIKRGIERDGIILHSDLIGYKKGPIPSTRRFIIQEIFHFMIFIAYWYALSVHTQDIPMSFVCAATAMIFAFLSHGLYIGEMNKQLNIESMLAIRDRLEMVPEETSLLTRAAHKGLAFFQDHVLFLLLFPIISYCIQALGMQIDYHNAIPLLFISVFSPIGFTPLSYDNTILLRYWNFCDFAEEDIDMLKVQLGVEADEEQALLIESKPVTPIYPHEALRMRCVIQHDLSNEEVRSGYTP